jgi:hypothetical protein
MKRIIAFALLALAAMHSPARAEAPPVVVELFTSQGCSSCPPADDYLRELAATPGILAFSLHVDYWNRLGWSDPFSSPEITARQRDYAGSLGGGFVYTPQMVVMGRAQAVGSKRAEVARLIARARAERAPPPAITISRAAPARLHIAIGAEAFVGRATVWLVAYDALHTTKIGAGENGGRTLTYANVVRAMRPVGQWIGRTAEFDVDIAMETRRGYERYAVLVQAGTSGPVIGGAALPVRSR